MGSGDAELSDPLKGLPMKEKRARIKEILEREGWYDIKGTSDISRNERLRIIKIVANFRGYECLSTKYVNNYTKIEFRCNECGWNWWAKSNSIISIGSGCLKCSGNLPYTTETLNIALNEHGCHLCEGEEIKKKGVLAKYWVQWKKCGHKTYVQVSSIINNDNGCLKCSKHIPYTTETLNVALKLHGAHLCKGEEIQKGGSHTKYWVRWERCGHKTHVEASSIINNDNGCLECYKTTFYTTETLNMALMEHGCQLCEGERIKKGRICAKYWVKWGKCGHKTYTYPNNIINNGYGCPKCGNKTENSIREMLYRATGHMFPHCSPSKLKKMGIYLKNTNGNCMELDGYCPNFVVSAKYPNGTAFEHHGDYHTNGESHIYAREGGKERFERRKADDKLKREQCEKQGILLIEVWGDDNIVYPNFSVIYDELTRVLKRNGINPHKSNVSNAEWLKIINSHENQKEQRTLF